VRSLKL